MPKICTSKTRPLLMNVTWSRRKIKVLIMSVLFIKLTAKWLGRFLNSFYSFSRFHFIHWDCRRISLLTLCELINLQFPWNHTKTLDQKIINSLRFAQYRKQILPLVPAANPVRNYTAVKNISSWIDAAMRNLPAIELRRELLQKPITLSLGYWTPKSFSLRKI